MLGAQKTKPSSSALQALVFQNGLSEVFNFRDVALEVKDPGQNNLEDLHVRRWVTASSGLPCQPN